MRPPISRQLAFLLSLSAAATTGAQSPAAGAPATPCRADSLRRAFDFWAGDWAVTNSQGVQVGTSHVEVVSDGCGLLENWRDARGGEGKSLNTYDPVGRQWRQFWVGAYGAVTDYSRSEWHDGTLSFFANVRATPSSPAAVLRLSFSPLARDLVRQHGEISTDGGKTWATQYDFRYTRRTSGSALPAPSPAQASSPVYEVRTYTIAPGRLADEYERFRREWLTTYFPRHNLNGILYLAPTDTPLVNNTLIYILRHPSREAADQNWAAFLADSGVKAVSARWNANGRIVTKVDRVFATATDFSPTPSASAELQVASCDSAQAAHIDDVAAVCRVNAQWDEANQKMDAALVEPILDPQFFWASGSRLQGKADIVNILRTTPVRFATYASADVVVYLGQDMAQAVGVSHRQVRIGATDGDGAYRFTRTFVKRGDRWLILSHQYTFLGKT